MRKIMHLSALFLFVQVSMGVAAVTGAASARSDDDRSGQPDVNPRWLDRLDSTDRALIEENLGYAPPQMTSDLEWIGGASPSWEALRGKVVVVQSWTGKTPLGRSALQRAQRLKDDLDTDDLVVVALHTPEGADTARRFLEQRPVDVNVVIDSKGKFCDEFGFYKRPANVLIDRNGAVRYAGLNGRGMSEAVELLLAESFDENKKPQARPAAGEGSGSDGSAGFPPFNSGRLTAKDIQGGRAPDLYVQQWLNGTPDVRGKVVVIDFWATWCPPCRRAIPHMNQIAAKFSDDLVAIGISDEPVATVTKFMQSTPIRYFSAIDQSDRMSRFVGVTGIPHVIIMSGDWVVRWQGNPLGLDATTVEQIVAANRKMSGAAGGNRYRWSGGA